MYQLHVQDFGWFRYRYGHVEGYLSIYYSNRSNNCFMEEYKIDVEDSSLHGWDPAEIDVNLLAPFIPSCVTFVGRVYNQVDDV